MSVFSLFYRQNIIHRQRARLSALLAFTVRGLYLLMSWGVNRLPAIQILTTAPYQITRPLLDRSPLADWVLNVWFQWDAGWYLKIAAFGYAPQDGSTAFAPLYPWIWRSANAVIGHHWMLTASLLNLLFTFLAIWVWWEVFANWTHTQQSFQAILGWVVFPVFFFMLAPYTESLFLALTGGAWLAAEKKRWPMAGFLSALAVLTRFQGLLLTPVLFWLAAFGAGQVIPSFLTRVTRPKPTWNGSALWSLAPLAAFYGWTGWLRYQHMDTPAQALQRRWGIPSVPPWRGAAAFWTRLTVGGQRIPADWLDLGVLLLVLWALWVGWRHLPAEANLYVWGAAALVFTRGQTPHLMDSFSRYALSFTPLFALIPRLPRVWRLIYYLTASALQLFFLIAFLKGGWAG